MSDENKDLTSEEVTETESSENETTEQTESTKSFNHEETKPVVGERKSSDKKLQVEEVLNFLMDHPDVVRSSIERLKNDKLPGTKENNAKYLAHIASAFGSMASNNNTDPFQNIDIESLWRQSVEHNDSEIQANRPRLKSSNGELSGEAVDMRIRKATGLGTMTNVPLWHTGIWVKIKAPMEATLLEMERRLANDKMILGRSTLGTSFNNTSVFMSYILMEMILNHVYDGTYNQINPKALKSVIKVTDIPTLVWGMAATIWPNGYPLSRPCVANALKCNHVDEAHVNLSKLHWVNNRMLSPTQRTFMAKLDVDVKDDDLEKYQTEHQAPQFKTVKIDDGISFKLKVPTILEYEESGFKWIDSIVNTADKAFGKELRGDERENYLNEQAQISRLRRYSHWVEEIIFHEDDDESSVSKDRDDIDRSLEVLSATDEFYDKAEKCIEEFIQKSIVAAIGIPRYTCPKCKGEPHPSDIPENLPEIIQLEVNEVFFILLSMRVQKMLGAA